VSGSGNLLFGRSLGDQNQERKPRGAKLLTRLGVIEETEFTNEIRVKEFERREQLFLLSV